MTCGEFQAFTIEDTDKLGQWLAENLPTRCVICLTGTLGSGKTRLVKAIATACQVPPLDVVSPTFVLCQHYQGTRLIHHFDAYRLNDDDEFLELGCEETFESDALSIVEWGERVKRCLPDDRLQIRIEIEPDCRRFVLECIGQLDVDLGKLPSPSPQS